MPRAPESKAPLAGKGEGRDGKWSQLSLVVMLRRPTRHPDHCVVRGASEVSHAQSPLFTLDLVGVLIAHLDELA